MMCHYLVRRHCTSEAENTIVDKLVLFQKTRGGRIIFPDRSVEWKLKCARQSGLGHFYNKGSEAKFISHNLITCNQHPDFLKPEKSTLKSKRKKIEFNTSYLESFRYQIDSNMWHGEPKVVPMKKFVERSKYQPSDEENCPLRATDLESPDGKACLYADSAFIISNGKKRVCEYFAKVLTDQHNTRLLPEALRLLLEWGKANNFEQLERKRKLTKALILREIEHHNKNTLLPLEKRETVDIRNSRPDLIHALLRLRHELKHQDELRFGENWVEADWIRRRTIAIEKWYDEMSPGDQSLGQKKKKKKKLKVKMSKPRTLDSELLLLKKFSRSSKEDLVADREYTKTRAQEELNFHNAQLPESDRVYPRNANMSTKEWANLIERVRILRREKDREQIGLPWSEEDWKLRLDEQISNWYHREDEDCEPLDVRIKEELQDPFFTFAGTNAKISESAQCKFDCSSVSLPVMVDENAEDEPVNQEETQAEEDVSECNSDDLCFDEDFDI